MQPDKRPISKLWRVILVAASAAVIFGLAAAGSQIRLPKLPASLQVQPPGTYRVVEVLDGDTIVVDIGGYRDTVRLIGVDTPETHDPRKPVQCFGQAATSFSRQLMENQPVRLETDPADSDRDKYQRLLRYVYLPDGKLVNAEIIKQGYGFAYTIFPYAKLEEFRALEATARAEGRGLWSTCLVDESRQVKQTSPE